ncbi:MAG TPA: fumarylacetoacetate hydrolase family protein [Polyangiales bacterium]|nr:fumarylacetoacetate hydrolase family protein [Polyangiales bacterium]
MSARSEVARTLALGRLSGGKLANHPGPKPANVAEAIAVQHEVTLALGWKPCGWKVGATSPRAQQLLGVEAPFAAPLFAERLFQSGDRVGAAPSNSRVVEPEIAFVMGRALPLAESAYTPSDVLAVVATVHAAFELVNPRLPLGFKEPVEWLIADGGINDAFVLGPGVAPGDALDYAGIQVRAHRDAAPITEGVGANALGGPHRVLVWLANHLRERGIALAPGDIVTTGLVTDVIVAEAVDEIAADFSGIGEVRVRY